MRQVEGPVVMERAHALFGVNLPEHSFFAWRIHFAIVVGPPPFIDLAQTRFALVIGPVVHPSGGSHHGLLSERGKSEQKSEKAEGNHSHAHGRILKQFCDGGNERG